MDDLEFLLTVRMVGMGLMLIAMAALIYYGVLP
jgi:hypothetical protein